MRTVWNLASGNHLETEWASGGREIDWIGRTSLPALRWADAPRRFEDIYAVCVGQKLRRAITHQGTMTQDVCDSSRINKAIHNANGGTDSPVSTAR